MLTGEDPYKFIQLGDQSFQLLIDETSDISQGVIDVICRLMRSEGYPPITSATEALQTFLHLL